MERISPQMLWSKVHDCFETDDGSLPAVELQRLTPLEVGRLYSLIRASSQIVDEDPSFWDEEAGMSRALDDVPNAGLLVALGKASVFHFVAEGLSANGALIPALGVQVFQDTIAVDYRMGGEWNERSVFAFFSWLDNLISETAEGILAPSTPEGPPAPDAFMAAWDLFRKHSSK